MEFPNLGEHCNQTGCNKLDFLPMKCEVCKNSFCGEHYSSHGCELRKDNTVPVCPLCNQPIPMSYGQSPDLVVSLHIDQQCSSPLSQNKRIFTNKCIVKGCKNKEVVAILCNECKKNYCLKHRHPVDHRCKGKLETFREKALENNLRDNQDLTKLDEMLARQLASSMQNSSRQLTQEELDFQLAQQLQMSSHDSVNNGNRRDRCNLS